MATSSAVQDIPLSGPAPDHVRQAHARMLSESLSDRAGYPFPVQATLDLLVPGVYVNCTIVGVVGAESLPAESAPRYAAEVIAKSADGPTLLVRPEAPDEDLPLVRVVEVDFTEPSGTYRLAGAVGHVTHGASPCLSITVTDAYQVQLRRFVRVSLHETPIRLDVQEGAEHWRPVHGQIIDFSVGGLGLLMDEPLHERAMLRVEFELPGKLGLITIRGMLILPAGPAESRAPGTMGRSFPFRRGIAFSPLSADDLKRLQRALYNRQVELRRAADRDVAEPPDHARDSGASAAEAAKPRWRLWG